MADRLLEIKNLRTYFFTYGGVVEVLNGLNLSVERGEMLGLIGETGSGKSVAAKSIINLVDYPGRIVAGEVIFDGQDLLRKSDDELQRIRGNKISLIVSEPRLHLNPLITVGDQIANVYRAHNPDASSEDTRRRTISMLRSVGIQDAERRAKSYAHQLSGGMAQRVLIGMALIGSPQLLLSDDATSNLDVSIQRQILDLMKDLISERGSSVVIITHDLGVVAQYCQRVAVMYRGQAVEEAPVKVLFRQALHPYTLSLFRSVRLKFNWKATSEPSSAPGESSAQEFGADLGAYARLATADDDSGAMIEVSPGHFVKPFQAVRRDSHAASG